MDNVCRNVIIEFTRNPSLVKCLELAGYNSHELISSIDSNEIDQVEQYVRDTCRLMSKEKRNEYIGDVFGDNPEAFKFALGHKKGLIMAAQKIASTFSRVDQAIQTDVGFGQTSATIACLMNLQQSPLSGGLSSNGDSFIQSGTSTNGRAVNAGVADAFASTREVNKMGPFVMVSQQIPTTPVGSGAGSAAATPPANSPTTYFNNHNNNSASYSPDLAVVKTSESLIPATCVMSGALLSRSDVIATSGGGGAGGDIDVERIKTSTSASLGRLCAKQFIAADLVESRDYDLDVEITPMEDGGRLRVTGIFCCRLCCEKRDRMTPVRFSVARNRYPVVSNIMSHLKLHFASRSILPIVSAAAGGDSALTYPVRRSADAFATSQVSPPFSCSSSAGFISSTEAGVQSIIGSPMDLSSVGIGTLLNVQPIIKNEDTN